MARLAMIKKMEHMAKVQKAAEEAKPKQSMRYTDAKRAQLEAVRPSKEKRIATLCAARTCDATARHTGQRCQAPVLKGATRCRFHGGLRQVPAHPANIRRLLDGTMAKGIRNRITAAQWAEAGPDERQAVSTAVGGAALSYDDKAAGLAALRQIENDNGRAWRDWITQTSQRRRKKNR